MSNAVSTERRLPVEKVDIRDVAEWKEPPRITFDQRASFQIARWVLVIFGGIGRLIRYKMWRSEGMPYPPHWSPGWHKHHQPHYRDEAPSSDKPSKGDESGSDANPSA